METDEDLSDSDLENSSEESSEEVSSEEELSSESESEREVDELCLICNLPINGVKYICTKCPQAFHPNCRLKKGKFKGKMMRQIYKKINFQKCKDVNMKCTNRAEGNSSENLVIAWSTEFKESSRRCEIKQKRGSNWRRVWEYENVSIGKECFKLGDCIRISLETDVNGTLIETFSYAVLLSVWKSDVEHFDNELTNGHADILWFFKPDEVKPKKLLKNASGHEKELFLASNDKLWVQTIEVSTIDSKIEVTSEDKVRRGKKTLFLRKKIYRYKKTRKTHRFERLCNSYKEIEQEK